MARQNIKTFTGNRIQVEFDGKAVGLVQSVRMSDSYGLEGASGIGDIHDQEFVPTKASHQLSVSTMTLFVGNMRAAGITPENGDAALKGLEFDFVQYSKDSAKSLRKYIGCVYDSGSVDVSAHRIVMSSAEFKARDVTGLGF